MPTLHFLFYIIAVILAYLFKLGYLGWFGPYLLAATIFVPLLLLLLSLPGMLSTEVHLEADPYSVQNVETPLHLVFKNPRLFPVSCVRLQLSIENLYAEEVNVETQVLHRVESGINAILLPSTLCGTLRCRITRFECRDMLGLFSLKRKCPDALYCTILPEPNGPDGDFHVYAALQTPARFKPKYGGGYSEEHDLREYRPGDTINSIHWKLSSKMDEVIVREPLERENREVFVVLARTGIKDRGLEVLYWLSKALCDLEVPHFVVANRMYPVGNEQELVDALTGILSTPITEPCSYDAANTRCVFLISSGEVHVG